MVSVRCVRGVRGNAVPPRVALPRRPRCTVREVCPRTSLPHLVLPLPRSPFHAVAVHILRCFSFPRSRPALSYGTRSLPPRHCLRCGVYYYIRQLLSIVVHPVLPFVGRESESRSQLSLILAIRVFAALSLALVSDSIRACRTEVFLSTLQTVLLLSQSPHEPGTK